MIRAFIWRLTRLFRRDADADFDAEMATHYALLADRYMRQGMSPEEAAAAARRQFGNTTLLKEDRRAMQTFPAMEELSRDLRYGARVLRKSPSFTVTVILTLALSIGANTAIFSVVSGLLLRPLPFRQPERLMLIEDRWMPRFPSFETRPEHFQAWREQSRAFEQLAAYATVGFTITGDGRPERVSGARVTASLPSLLGVNPILGRGFSAADDHEGSDFVVLLGNDLWRRRFGGDPKIVGRVLTLNNVGFTVIGVMPPEFRFPEEAEIWKPMAFTAADANKGHFIRAVGRLKPAVTSQQAQAELDLIMPRVSDVWRAAVTPLLNYYVGNVRTALLVLLGAAGFVLLIACVNVANLQLARGSVRQKEISLCLSLGAGRGRVVRQLLAESFLLAALGGGLAILVGLAGISALKAIAPAGIPRLDQVSVDARTLLYTAVLSMVTALLFGILPALRVSGVALQSGLAAGSRGSGAGFRGGMRYVFMVSEIALALVLLTGAGLLLKSFDRLLRIQTGFQSERLVAVTINLPGAKYREPHQRIEFVARLLEKLEGNPDVRQAAVTVGLPFASAMDVGIVIERPSNPAVGGGTANYYAVTPSYFKTMGIPLLRGRWFTERDAAGAPPVAVINETMAKVLFDNADPIGRRLDISGPTYMREIVGVVGDVKQSGLKTKVAPQVYEPFLQKPANGFHVVIRGSDPARLAETVRSELFAIDKDQPVSKVRIMQESVAQSVTQDRLSTFVLALFAGLAMILAASGIYGVFGYSYSQRTREIGIRIALGARREEVLKLVLAHCLRLVLFAVAIGIGASALLTRYLSTLLYEVKPGDPIVVAAVSVILIAVALAAAFGPAWRCSRVDPVIALKFE